MIKLPILLSLLSLSTPSSAKDNFTLMDIRSANPANIKIDLRVDNPTKKTRPVTENGRTVIPVDFSKIKIFEDGKELSSSEGGRAQFASCTSCSLNVIHITLDFSGSVRGQFGNLVNSTISFLENMSSATGKTLVRLSFFAGENKLYNLTGYKNYYFEANALKEILINSGCDSFTLNGESKENSLCNSDSATRLNSAIVNNLAALEESKTFFKDSENVSYTSVIFTDGMGRDAGVSESEVREKIEGFKNGGGVVYGVFMKSDEENSAFFKSLNLTKVFEFKRMEKFTRSLIEVQKELNDSLPVFYTIAICSGVRGGKYNLRIESTKYDIPASEVEIDASNFKAGCDVSDTNQWNF